MPTANLVFLPTSVSRGGNTLTNLRGVIEVGKCLEYAGSINGTSVTDISQVTTAFQSNSGAWTSTIRYAFEPASQSNSSYIQYGNLLSGSVNVTFMFRMLLNTLINPIYVNPYLFYNGDLFLNNNGYGLVYDGQSSNLLFLIAENLSFNYASIPINSSMLNTNQWYHYAIKITTTLGNTTVDWWENGAKQVGSNLGWQFQSPAGGITKFFNDPFNSQVFWGKLTDFVFLDNNPLTDAQISAFGSAPFV